MLFFVPNLLSEIDDASGSSICVECSYIRFMVLKNAII